MSEEDIILENEIQKKQQALDKGWNKPKKKRWFIGIREVSEEDYINYQREQLEIIKNHKLDEFYTSTGEEWETDSDGDYTPDWMYDKI